MLEFSTIKRRKSRKVMIKDVGVGGDSPITVQSMTNTKTDDIESTVNQIISLENAGCDIIRVAVPDMASAEAISKIKEQIHIPIVADVHFDYRLAIEAIKQGADGLRINPGNIGDAEIIKKLLKRQNHLMCRLGSASIQVLWKRIYLKNTAAPHLKLWWKVH